MLLQRLTRIPWPLSCICNNFNPPSLAMILILVAPASSEFSISSLRAPAGRGTICCLSMSNKAIDAFVEESTCLTSSNAVDYLSIERSDLWYVHIMCVCVSVCVYSVLMQGSGRERRAVFDQKKKGAAAALTHDNFLNQTHTHTS